MGFELRDGDISWDRLKDNIESIGGLTEMISYMHKLRNFDPESIGKWKNDKQKRQLITSLRYLKELNFLLK